LSEEGEGRDKEKGRDCPYRLANAGKRREKKQRPMSNGRGGEAGRKRTEISYLHGTGKGGNGQLPTRRGEGGLEKREKVTIAAALRGKGGVEKERGGG